MNTEGGAINLITIGLLALIIAMFNYYGKRIDNLQDQQNNGAETIAKLETMELKKALYDRGLLL